MSMLQFFRQCDLIVRQASILVRATLCTAGLLTLASVPASAQSVAFFGMETQFSLPVYLPDVTTTAVDSKGDLFVLTYSGGTYEQTNVEEYVAGPAGFSAPVTIPIAATREGSFFLDKDDNLFVPQPDGSISELPKTAEGYGAPITIPCPLPSGDGILGGVAVDESGDIFAAVSSTNPVGYRTAKLLNTKSGYGAPILGAIHGGYLYPSGIQVDGDHDVFLAVYHTSGRFGLPFQIFEVTPTGTTLLPSPASGFDSFQGMAIDSKANIFVTGAQLLVELLNTPSGYVPLQHPPLSQQSFTGGVAVDRSGTLFVYPNTKIDSHVPATFGKAYDCTVGSPNRTLCSQTFKMSYSFTANVNLGTPQVVSLNGQALDFTLDSAGSCTGGVPAASICSLAVTFAPKATGARSGVVEIVDSKGNLLASTPITGQGLSTSDAPQAQVSPSILQFGTLPYKTTETLPITITNVGGAKLNVASPSIDAKSFSITGNTCTAGLGSGQSCTLQVQFNPVHIATFRNSLTVKTNGIAATSKVGLQAIGSGITVAGAPMQFGAVTYGASEALNLTVVNHWLPGAVTLQASATGSSYSFPQNAQNTCSAGIVSGGHCTLPVLFTPNGVGAHNAILTLTPSGGGAPFTVSLHGEGGGLLPGAHFLQFGSIPLGSAAVLPLTVTNSNLPDSVNVQVAASGPSYSVLNGSQNTCQAGVAPGATCTLLIQFSPVGVGLHNGILRLTPSSGGTSISVALDGQATTR